MASVYTSNIVINSGTDFSQTFTLESANSNSPLDLNEYSVFSQMRKYAGSANQVTFSTTISDPPSLGKIIISLNSAQTSALKPGRYVYDVLISRDSVITRVIEGMVLVREGVTKP